MKFIDYFREVADPKILASHAGISIVDWTCVTTKDSASAAYNSMISNSFDVIPIVNYRDRMLCQEYFTTKQWGIYDQDSIERQKITSEDKIYFLTHIEDVIKRFVDMGRKFFFLYDYNEVIGLITIGNLNCRQVYLYVYHHILNIERLLAEQVANDLSEDDAIEILTKKYGPKANRRTSLGRYWKDKSKGTEENIFEYLMLHDIAELLNGLDFTNYMLDRACDIKARLNALNDTRIRVAHPSKSLISKYKDLHTLNQSLADIGKITTLIQAYNSEIRK